MEDKPKKSGWATRPWGCSLLILAYMAIGALFLRPSSPAKWAHYIMMAVEFAAIAYVIVALLYCANDCAKKLFHHSGTPDQGKTTRAGEEAKLAALPDTRDKSTKPVWYRQPCLDCVVRVVAPLVGLLIVIGAIELALALFIGPRAAPLLGPYVPPSSGLTLEMTVQAVVEAERGSTRFDSVCEWYSETREVTRTSDLVADWFSEELEKLDAQDFKSHYDSGTVDLADWYRNQMPPETAFIEKWQELGAFPGGEDYWENELRASVLCLQAFDRLAQGLDNHDLDKYNEGVALLRKSVEYESIARDARENIDQQCAP